VVRRPIRKGVKANIGPVGFFESCTPTTSSRNTTSTQSAREALRALFEPLRLGWIDIHARTFCSKQDPAGRRVQRRLLDDRECRTMGIDIRR
jgi:hypothetical protein